MYSKTCYKTYIRSTPGLSHPIGEDSDLGVSCYVIYPLVCLWDMSFMCSQVNIRVIFRAFTNKQTHPERELLIIFSDMKIN